MATGFSKTILTENEANNLDTNGQNNKSQPRIKMKRETSSGTLEIFGHGNYSRENSSSSFDNSLNRTKKEKPAPRPNSKSGLDRTTPTSSKQISLQTVRRKPESDDMELQDLEVHNEEKEKSLNERLEKLNLSGRGSRTFFQRNSAQDEDIKNNRNKSASDDDDDDDDDNDDNDSSEDEDDEKPKAPNELFMEFLTCIMNKDYTTAKKLCRMILIFEPDHEEALSFQKLIDEKILLDEEPDVSEDEERESGHEELDSDSGSDDGDDDTSSDDSSDSSDEDSRPSTVDTTDSGIVSTSSD